MLVIELMTPAVRSVSPDLSLSQTARTMRDLNIGSLPVLDEGRLIGMITDRDICCRAVAEARDAVNTRVRDVMSRDVAYCFLDQDVSIAAYLMERKQIRRLAVLDREMRLAGFLSVDDLARWSHDLAGEVLEAASAIAH